MVKLHSLVKLLFVVLALGIVVFGYKFLTNSDKVKEANYANATDVHASFKADEEIAAALKKLEDENITAAEVLTHLNADQVAAGFLLSKDATLATAEKSVENLEISDLPKVIALTFDGLPAPTTTKRLLKVLEENKTNATFFVEGANASMHKESIEEIEAKGQNLGNYTYIGLARLDKAPQKIAVKELCKTQKVLKITANQSVELFKAPKTGYNPELLKAAKACGLNKGVKTDIFVNTNQLQNAVDAEKFVREIPAGSIVSIVIGRPVENIVQKDSKIDDRPAYDKRPTVKITPKTKEQRQDVVEATKLLIAACKKLNTELVPVKNMRSVKLVEPEVQEQPVEQAFLDGLLELGNNLFGCSIAYAAPDHYAEIKAKNNGKLAQEMKMIHTTEQAVAYSFVGFSRPQEVHNVLDRLKLLGCKGTFFVNTKDIENNPVLMKRILDEGHELGIAVYAMKSGNFTTVARQIEATRRMLWNKYRVSNNLVKQPWGVIEDYTREAIAAENCVLVGQYVSAVQSKHKSYREVLDIMPELFGKFVYSLGRGWIVNFRMDFYDEPGLCADLLQIIKEQKIDNIAYWSVDDDPALNPRNDSAYKVKSVGSIYRNKQYRYELPVQTAIPELRYENNRVSEESLREYIGKRYIGTPTVSADANALGFTQEELRYADLSGVVHTEKPVVFLGFDDWGTDQAINKLLYVLRKHNAKATFFIITRNVKNNPNLLRAIALEGHDIASHTDSHRPLAINGKFEHMKHGLTREERFKDLETSYRELERLTGDIVVDGHPALTKMFRAPTLAISKLGFEELRATGFEWLVSGSHSTHDYAQPTLYDMVAEIKAGLYEKDKVVKGAVFIAHMSDVAKFTPGALDVLLTINEQRPEGDPRKFVVGRLSDYLVDEYRQDNKQIDFVLERMRK